MVAGQPTTSEQSNEFHFLAPSTLSVFIQTNAMASLTSSALPRPIPAPASGSSGHGSVHASTSFSSMVGSMASPQTRMPPAPPATPVGSLFSPCASLSASFIYGFQSPKARSLNYAQHAASSLQPTQQVLHFDPYPRAPHSTPASSFVDSYLDGARRASHVYSLHNIAEHHADSNLSTENIASETSSCLLLPFNATAADSSYPSPQIDMKESSFNTSANASSVSAVDHSPCAINDEDRDHNDTTTSSSITYMCDHCGKQYKHAQCLHKHKWEHSVYWKETAKLYLSKHQQVQLLEAAQILVSLPQKISSSTSPSSDNASPNCGPLPSLPEATAVSLGTTGLTGPITRPRALSRSYGQAVKTRSRTVSLPSAFAATSLQSSASDINTISSLTTGGQLFPGYVTTRPHGLKQHKLQQYPYTLPYTTCNSGTSSGVHSVKHTLYHRGGHHSPAYDATHDFTNKLTTQLEAIHYEQQHKHFSQHPSRQIRSAASSSESTVPNSPSLSSSSTSDLDARANYNPEMRSASNLKYCVTGDEIGIDSGMSVVDIMAMDMDMESDATTPHTSTTLPFYYPTSNVNACVAPAYSNDIHTRKQLHMNRQEPVSDNDAGSMDTEGTEDEDVSVL